MKFKVGPSALVAAAFIGPGTVTTCTLAGANFGTALLWALAFATLATIILQDMAGRLGAGAGRGLGEALLTFLPTGAVRWAAIGLVLVAILLGNAAYQAGNIAGGALGLGAVLDGAAGQKTGVALIAVVAALALGFGRYRTLEKILVGLVLLMALAFVAAFVMVRPDLGTLLSGFVPRLPDGAALTAIALIGTTIVPYNLFLHAAAAKRRWPDGNGAAEARADTIVCVGLGGIVSMLILATAASALFGAAIEVTSAAEMAMALEPAFGEFARILLGVGLLGAGLTSAITAPLAAGFVAAEFFPGADPDRAARRQKLVSLAILAIGTAVALSGIRPVTLILIAQAANGFLLPVIAGFLLWVMNRRDRLGAHANGLVSNLLGGAVVLITVGLGLRGIARAFGLWP